VNSEASSFRLFIRVGSKRNLGDLNLEYAEAISLAQKKPDLKALDTEVRMWFARLKQHGN